MAKKKPSTSFFEVFSGEHITIIINQNIEQSVTDGETLQTVKSPISVSGYLTDEDDSFYYLGLEPGLYHQAIKKEMVTHAALSEEEDVMSEILNNVEAPTKNEEYN